MLVTLVIVSLPNYTLNFRLIMGNGEFEGVVATFKSSLYSSFLMETFILHFTSIFKMYLVLFFNFLNASMHLLSQSFIYAFFKIY